MPRVNGSQRRGGETPVVNGSQRLTGAAAPGDGAKTLVALAIESSRYRRIAAILEREGFRCVAFEHAEEPDRLPALIVLRGENGNGSLARQVEQVCRKAAERPVVVLCATSQRRQVRAALAAGAVGVVLEDELSQALGPCLRAVQAGQVCVPRRHFREIEPPALSTREKQILGLVVMGHMNGQIAERLFLAESTVKSHLSSAFDKLGVRSRNEAVELILDPERGLGMGILALGGEPLKPTAPAAR